MSVDYITFRQQLQELIEKHKIDKELESSSYEVAQFMLSCLYALEEIECKAF